jgi:D-alanine-D-alanine ligase
LAEPFIAGLELTVAVLEGETGTAEPLAVTELKPLSGFYDYEAKYTDGKTVHVCPADIPAEVTATALEQAALAHRVLGCRGVSRADFRFDPSEGSKGLYLLEVNTQPGMTPLSLVPEQAKARGISYEALVGRLIERALA